MTREEAIKVLRTESVELGGNAVSVCRFLEALDTAIAALREQEGKDTNAPTNADHIRSMTDEELARWLYNFFWCGKKYIHLSCILGWLQLPAEDGEDG